MKPDACDAAEAMPIHPLDAERAAVEPASAAVVGAKGANLLRMAALGLPVPTGFILGTALCRYYHAHGATLPPDYRTAIAIALERLEARSGLRFGGTRRPLLLAVRSGAAQSMPGMLETLLNVGMNDLTVSGLVRSTGNPRLAWDSYRRYIRAYAEVVHGSRSRRFDELASAACAAAGATNESELDTPAQRRLAREYLELFQAVTGQSFPQDPLEQLHAAVEAVLRSWHSPHARAYRAQLSLDHAAGTAVTVQVMVFGNAGAASGAGVGFTRDPATGRRGLYLDFAFNAQGEDVVGGRHSGSGGHELAQVLPGVHTALVEVAGRLESAFGDLQDFEFTVQDGQLYLLQTRAGKRSPLAALTIAVDLVEEGVLTPREALARLADLDLGAVYVTRFADADGEVLAAATPASLGVASGPVVFDVTRAQARAAAGETPILLRHEASTEDFSGIAAAAGLLTAVGAKTSHAAVVARELGRVCLVACRTLAIDVEGKGCLLNGRRLREGDPIALDGDRGLVYAGRREIVHTAPAALIERVRAWREGSADAAS